MFQPPDVHLVIEVTPPGTPASDHASRPRRYAAAGIPCYWRVDREENAMVISTFDLLPEGAHAPTGAFRRRLQADRPFPVDITVPEVRW